MKRGNMQFLDNCTTFHYSAPFSHRSALVGSTVVNFAGFPAHRVGALSVDGRCLSFLLSLPCLTLSREWKGIRSWQLTGWQLMTRVTRDPI